MKKDFDTDVLSDKHHTFSLSATFVEYGQNVNKPHLIEKADLGKIGGVYVTDVADLIKDNDM